MVSTDGNSSLGITEHEPSTIAKALNRGFDIRSWFRSHLILISCDLGHLTLPLQNGQVFSMTHPDNSTINAFGELLCKLISLIVHIFI